MKTPDSSTIYQHAKKNSVARIGASESSAKEVLAVESYSKPLFGPEFALTLEETERFRMLCKFAVAELQPPIIRSHRALIGPIIVTAKKFAWRILSALLKQNWESQRFFNRTVVRQLAESRKSNQRPS